MATLRDILRKITAVKKTRQITKAMNMVAASRLRSVQGKMESFEPYASKFHEVLQNLSSRLDEDIHPLLVQKEEVRRVELLHFTADRGLCGSFNVNSINRAVSWIDGQVKSGRDVSITTVGIKGRDYFTRRDYRVTDSYTHIYGHTDISFVNQMAYGFINRFLNDEIDELHMLYTRFEGMSRQENRVVKLIPIEPPKEEEGAEAGMASEYLCEPSPSKLLMELLPKHISVQLFNAFLQNETCEHAARMAAMDKASKNCNELIENLTLVYNKARQAAITAELMDIVCGAEALK